MSENMKTLEAMIAASKRKDHDAFLDTLKRIAGDYAGKVDPSAIIESKGGKDIPGLNEFNQPIITVKKAK